MFLLPFVAAFIGLLLFFIYLNYSLSFKRALYVRKMRDFRSEWKNELITNFEYFNLLNSDFQEKLLDKISIFSNEKNWNKDISDKRKLIICARACLPIVNRKSNFYPMLKDHFADFSQVDWFCQNEIQFEKEVGKMPLREFKGEFARYSMDYFKDPKSMKLNNKRFFDLLNFYYKLS